MVKEVDNCFELLSVARMATHQFDVAIEMTTDVFQIFVKVTYFCQHQYMLML